MRQVQKTEPPTSTPPPVMRRLLSTRDVPAVCKERCVDSPAGSSVVPPTRYQRPGGIVGQTCVVNAKKESGLLPVTLAISGALRFATTLPKSAALSVYVFSDVTGRVRWPTSPAKSKTTFERGERITVHGDLSKVGTSGSA